MDHTLVLMAGIPRTRYRRIGLFTVRPHHPLVDHVRKVVVVFFPQSPRLAYLIGAALGDGTITKRRVTYFNSDKQWLETVARELECLTDFGYRKPQVLPARGRSVPSIEFANSAFARLIGRSSSERLRSVEVLTKNGVRLAAFTAGLFDCEGSASIYSNGRHPKGTCEISIANADIKMLQILRSRIGEMGIHGGISVSAEPRDFVIEGREVRGRKPIYRLRFSGWSSAIIFARLILPWVKSRQKAERLERIVKRRIVDGAVGI